jgi:hypothetical protein
MNIWIIAIIAGFCLMVGFFVTMLLLDRKKGNITYTICKTFLGSQQWYTAQGMVDVKNDGTFMAEHMILSGGKTPIGVFHQKHLKTTKGGRYMMFLEEWDIARYRPLEYKGHIKGKSTMIRLIPQYKDGQLVRDEKGNIIHDRVEETVDIGRFKGIPNHDIDWILRRKEKNRLMLIRKEERNRWIPLVAAGGILVIAAIVVVLAAFYMNEMSVHIETASKNFADQKDMSETAKVIRDILVNGTFTEKVKATAPPPPGG